MQTLKSLSYRYAGLALLLCIASCGDDEQDPLTIGDGQGCSEGMALSVDGTCTAVDPTKEVFTVHGDDIDLASDGSTTPGEGNPNGQAEACCIFAVWSNGSIFQDPYNGQFIFTGACPLPDPWEPGAYGCGCVGNNLVLDPYSGYWYTVFGSWIGFTCLVD